MDLAVQVVAVDLEDLAVAVDQEDLVDQVVEEVQEDLVVLVDTLELVESKDMLVLLLLVVVGIIKLVT